MTIYFKEPWKNDLERRRLKIINLINEIFKESNEKTTESIIKLFNKISLDLNNSKYRLRLETITEEVD